MPGFKLLNSFLSLSNWVSTRWHSHLFFFVSTVPPVGFQVALVVKNPAANAGDVRDAGSIPGSGRSPGGGHGHPPQYSCLENSMDRGAWRATVHGVTRSQTWLKWLSRHACMLSAWDLSFLSRDRTLVPLHGKGRVSTTGPPGKPRERHSGGATHGSRTGPSASGRCRVWSRWGPGGCTPRPCAASSSPSWLSSSCGSPCKAAVCCLLLERLLYFNRRDI